MTIIEGDYADIVSPEWGDPRSWTELSFDVHRFGYGYAWRQSTTVRFGVSVLLIYLMLTTVFVMYLLYHTLIQRQWISSSWGSVGEIIALAINSTSTDRMQNTCAGIKKSETWRQTISIRETCAGHLELTVGEEKERAKMVRIGTRYGTLPTCFKAFEKDLRKDKID